MRTASSLVGEVITTGLRAPLDDRTTQGFGRRATEWVLKGVPVRLEVGPRDLESGQATITRRDTGAKEKVTINEISTTVVALLQRT
ncbi:His/Gly/Thr/Pro-type tRNA ligase C-terminal domain-containing protein [Paenarthrobacter sp. CAP02]|uniref:His/Gly/Thr/Pro-type tRNA ligase C-terminal domain-containing protein n=1 Tax=Paenarthrobacter sp. CAP02 TaxID=3158144 RepID=UPI0032D9C8E4